MEELNSSNVLEFWKKATIEQQRENIDRVLELISSDKILDMWKATKAKLKHERPDLIIRIIKEKQANGKMYTRYLWSNTPKEVQEQTIEEVFRLYKSEFMIRRIWRETHESVKTFSKGILAKALNYDEKLLKKYEIPEYIPAPPGMLGKKEIDDIVWGLIQLQSWEITQNRKAEAKVMMTQEMPITSIPYFFEQIAEFVPEDFIKMFWNSIEKDVQYKILEDVLLQIPVKELRKSIWNEIDSETQKRKIKELVKNNKSGTGKSLISITETYINREVLEEMLKENEANIAGIWGALPEEIQLEYFQNVVKMSSDEEIRDDIWGESAEQVQRSNFSQKLQEMNNDIDAIIWMMKLSKLPRAEIIEYISQKYQGKRLEEIIRRYELDVESLERLRGKISPEVSIKIVIRNASELSRQKLEELEQEFNITQIQMRDKNDNLEYWQVQPYDLETYKRCRTAIDELLDGIDLSENPDEPDREKRIFGEVIKRLADHISYDYETLKKLDDETATDEEKIMCASMIGGLINKTCVCSGYAEVVRNVFACCGIEVRYISGNNVDPEKKGHAWNQIKLDGVWYNMDLTWDRDRIVAGEMPYYLLMSDRTFAGHNEYDIKECKKEQCNETVSYEDMKWYLYKQLEIPKPVQRAVRRSRRRRVERAYEMVASSQALIAESPEKREEQWMQ